MKLKKNIKRKKYFSLAFHVTTLFLKSREISFLVLNSYHKPILKLDFFSYLCCAILVYEHSLHIRVVYLEWVEEITAYLL